MRANRSLYLLAALVVLGAGLRLALLAHESLWLDEVTSINIARRSVHGVLEASGTDWNPPLYYLLLHAWIRVMGDGEAGARSLSVVLGVLCIPAAYLLGRELFDDETGLVLGLLVAISSFHVHYSQEARMYSALALSSLVSVLFAARLSRAFSRLDAAGYVLSSSAMIYLHNYGLFVLLFQNAWFILVRGEGLRRWVALQLVVAVSFSPFVPVFLGQFESSMGRTWIERPSTSAAFDTLGAWAGGEEFKLLLFAVLSLLGILSLARASGGWDPRRPLSSLATLRWSASLADPRTVSLLALWALSVTALPIAISLAMNPIYVVRYSITGSIALYALVARSAFTFPSRSWRAMVLALLVVSSSAALATYYATPQREEWREVALFLEEEAGPGEPVLVNPPGWVEPLTYYRGVDGVFPLYEEEVELRWVNLEVVSLDDLPGLLSEHPTFWTVVVYGGSGYPMEYLSANCTVISRRSFYKVDVFHHKVS